MRYGVQTLSPKFFGGAPDIAVAGFNVGGKGVLTVRLDTSSNNPRFSKSW